jgi:hypothetical protein
MQIGLHSHSEKRDVILGVALIVLSGVIWFWLIPEFAGGHGEHVIVAEIATIMIASLAFLMAVLSFLGIPVESPAAEQEDPFLNTDLGAEPAGLWMLIAVWGVCIFSLQWIGFYVAGAAALVLTFLLVGVRSPLRIAAIVLTALVLVYVVFDLGFHLELPKGRLLHGFLS